ncbi:AI-2E family transporter [Parvularcula marina]|uniref:AI-2E family transporter n=1 Tax=Parvularcula marina TaxID=2292771 RepID=UPI003517FF82
MTEKKKQPGPPRSVAAAFYGLGLTIIVFFILWVAQGILVPLIVAALLSFLIVSVKNGLDRVPGIGRFMPGAVNFGLSFVIIVGILLVISLIVRENAQAVLEKAPEYQTRLGELATGFVSWAEGRSWMSQDAVEAMADFLDGLQGGMAAIDGKDIPADAGSGLRSQAFAAARGAIASATTAASTLLGNIVTVFLYTAFILIERGRFSRKLTRMAGSVAVRHRIDNAIDDVTRLIRTYVTMKTLINLTVASISFVLMLALGTDFAGFWALLIFVFGYVPIVGAVIAISLPVLLTLLAPDGGLGKAALTLLLLAGAEQSISSFVEPRVMGKSLNLSPLVILISLATWGSIWGFAGMLLSVPLTVVALITLSQFEATRPIAIMLSDNGEIAPLASHDEESTA